MFESFWRFFIYLFIYFFVLLWLKQKTFKRDCWEVLVLTKCIQSFRINSIIDLYIPIWLVLGRFSVSLKDVGEMNPGWRNVQMSLIVLHLSEISLGGMQRGYGGGEGRWGRRVVGELETPKYRRFFSKNTVLSWDILPNIDAETLFHIFS